MSWAAFIGAGVGAWVKKALTAIGVGVISYVGWAAVKDQLSAAIQDALSGLAANVYAVMALAGFVDAIGIWLAAMTTAVTLLTINKLGLLSS